MLCKINARPISGNKPYSAEEFAPQCRGEAGRSVRVPIHCTLNEIFILNNKSDLGVTVALAIDA